jgi:uncharacterized integral membrane protein
VIPRHPVGVEDRSVEASPRRGPPTRGRRQRARTIGAFALGGLAVLFAALNLDEVEVSWIVATWETPLIVVIAVSVLIGAVLGWVLARRRA